MRSRAAVAVEMEEAHLLPGQSIRAAAEVAEVQRARQALVVAES